MSFLSPAGLALSALAIPLVALYFLRTRRRRVRVPSLLAWHALQQREHLSSPFHRFRRNLLLPVQLLLLGLLVLAVARPTWESEISGFRSLVLLIDTSASMGAVDVTPNRLGRAVAEAEALLADLGPDDEVMVVSAGPRTRVLAPFTRDHVVARRALAGIRVTEARGDLAEGLALASSLARSRPDVQIVVLSDGATPELPFDSGNVRLVPIGTRDTNAGIVALDLRRSPVSEGDRQLFVTVRSFGALPVDGTVEVWLDDALVALRNHRLEPETPASMVFDLAADRSGTLRVRLASDGDVLGADDTAWAVLAPNGAREILLVGGDVLLARLLANDPRVQARQVAATAVTPAMLAEVDAVLFAGAVPEGIDGLDYAVLGPYPGSPVRFGARVEDPRGTDWERTHPVLRFTRWDDLTIGASREVTDPGGLTPIVEADAGALVLAGQRNGGRVVQLAFDPLQSDLPLKVGWPILVMNIVGWLTADPLGGEAMQVRTGAPFVRHVDGDAAPSIRGPGAPEVVVTDGVLRVTGTDAVGLYEVSAGDTRVRFAANLLSEAESQIRPRDTIGMQPPIEAPVVASFSLDRRELWRPLLLAAVGLLVLEWLLWNLRRTA